MSEDTFPGLTAEDLALASLAVHALRKAIEAKVENEREPLPLMYNAIGAALYGALSRGNMGITASRISTGWLKTLEDTLDLMSADFNGWFQLAFEQRLKSNFAAILGDSHLVSMGDMVDYYPVHEAMDAVFEKDEAKTELVSGNFQGPDEYALSAGADEPAPNGCIGILAEDGDRVLAVCQDCDMSGWVPKGTEHVGPARPDAIVVIGDSAGVRAEVEAAEQAGIVVKKPRRKKTRRTRKAPTRDSKAD